MHATDFLRKPNSAKEIGLLVLFGAERHLKAAALKALAQLVLGTSGDEAIGFTRFSGKDLDFKTVRDELQTVSMFSDQRLVVIEDADDFVTEFRPQLENYAEKPSKRSLLVLEVKTWRKNTRLSKKIEASGLEIECSELTGAKLEKWLISQMKFAFQKELSVEAAHELPMLVGNSLGHMEQELGKLASFAGERTKIELEDVRKLVGGWKADTTWAMVDAIRDGRTNDALVSLSKLLYAGEAGPKILGGLNYVFRKIAVATELSRAGTPLTQALRDAGVFPRDISDYEKYLRRIRFHRAERILETLAKVDFGLKGASRLSEQMQLEHLIMWLSGVPIEIEHARL